MSSTSTKVELILTWDDAIGAGNFSKQCSYSSIAFFIPTILLHTDLKRDTNPHNNLISYERGWNSEQNTVNYKFIRYSYLKLSSSKVIKNPDMEAAILFNTIAKCMNMWHILLYRAVRTYVFLYKFTWNFLLTMKKHTVLSHCFGKNMFRQKCPWPSYHDNTSQGQAIWKWIIKKNIKQNPSYWVNDITSCLF